MVVIIRQCTDIPDPVGVRAEVTADNTSIRVSWQWSRQGVIMCTDVVRVHYQPEGGSRMMYPVGNTTTTSVTLHNLQCNTKYTISVYAEGRGTGTTSVYRMVSLPARGRHLSCNVLYTSYMLLWTMQQLPVPPCPVSSATQCTPTVFML